MVYFTEYRILNLILFVRFEKNNRLVYTELNAHNFLIYRCLSCSVLCARDIECLTGRTTCEGRRLRRSNRRRESCHLDKISDISSTRALIALATLSRTKRNLIDGEQRAHIRMYIALSSFVFDRRNFLGGLLMRYLLERDISTRDIA